MNHWRGKIASLTNLPFSCKHELTDQQSGQAAPNEFNYVRAEKKISFRGDCRTFIRMSQSENKLLSHSRRHQIRWAIEFEKFLLSSLCQVWHTNAVEDPCNPFKPPKLPSNRKVLIISVNQSILRIRDHLKISFRWHHNHPIALEWPNPKSRSYNLNFESSCLSIKFSLASPWLVQISTFGFSACFFFHSLQPLHRSTSNKTTQKSERGGMKYKSNRLKEGKPSIKIWKTT